MYILGANLYILCANKYI